MRQGMEDYFSKTISRKLSLPGHPIEADTKNYSKTPQKIGMEFKF